MGPGGAVSGTGARSRMSNWSTPRLRPSAYSARVAGRNHDHDRRQRAYGAPILSGGRQPPRRTADREQ